MENIAGRLEATVRRPLNRWLDTAMGIQVVLVVIFALPLLAHALNMLNTRPLADDYVLSVIAREKGVLGAVAYWYNHWTGTPASIFGQSLVAKAGPLGNAVTPVLILTLWVGLLVMTTWLILRHIGFARSGWLAWILGFAVGWAVTAGIPNVYQSMYWTSGAVVYSGAMLLLTLQMTVMVFLIGYRPGRLTRTVGVLGVLGIAISAGAFTQTVAAMQLVGYGLGFLAVIRMFKAEQRRSAMVVVGAAVLGAIIALGITLAAPGNAVRQANFLPQSFLQTILLSVQNTAAFFAISLSAYSAVPLLLVILLTSQAVRRFATKASHFTFRQTLRGIALAVGAGLLLIMAYLAPAAYGMGQMPAARAWIVPQMILTLVAVASGSLIGLNLRDSATSRRPLASALLLALLLLLGPLLNTGRIVTDSQMLRVFAQEWDARHAALTQAVATGEIRAVVRPFSVDMAWYVGLVKPGEDMLASEFGEAVATYYALVELVREPG